MFFTRMKTSHSFSRVTNLIATEQTNVHFNHLRLTNLHDLYSLNICERIIGLI